MVHNSGLSLASQRDASFPIQDKKVDVALGNGPIVSV